MLNLKIIKLFPPEHPWEASPKDVSRYSNQEPGHEHESSHQLEDEEVDVDSDGEDEEDGEESEGDDDLLHDLGGLHPPPPDPHTQGRGQD